MDTLLLWCSKAQMQNLNAQLLTQLSPTGKSVFKTASLFLKSVSPYLEMFQNSQRGRKFPGYKKILFLISHDQDETRFSLTISLSVSQK